MASRSNRVLLIGVAIVVVAAIVAAVLAVNRQPATLDPATPEGVVQTYLQALADGDLAGAAELLSEDGECGLGDLAGAYLPASFRAVLAGTDERDTTAVVTVEITDTGDAGPFDSPGYTHTERLVLDAEDDGWQLTGAPWPMYDCLGRG